VIGTLRRLNHWVARAERVSAGALLIAVTGTVLIQIVMRYVLSRPNPWSEELSRFGFIWLSMLGASLGVANRKHFAFEQVVAALPPGWRRRLSRLVTGFIAACALLLIVTGVALVRLTAGQRTPALDLPQGLIYAAVPVAGVLMLIHTLAGAPRGGAEG